MTELRKAVPSATDNQSFRTAVKTGGSGLDAGLVALVALVLVGVFLLPEATREGLVFDRASPTLLTAYTSHFVHLHDAHLLGNLSVYLVVVPVTYLLCVLGGRRQLFRITFVTLLAAFPFALSAMQLVFPREREILGFSGINAGFFGLLCLAWLVYTGRRFIGRNSLRYGPAVLFLTTGVIALVALPARAWRFEIAAGSIALGILYLLVWFSRDGGPSLERIREGFSRPGYAELAGAGFGLIVAYPFVGFHEALTVETGVVDAYVHLLGYALAFIVVYAYVVITDDGI